MDFASLKNNPLYGPLRIFAGSLLAFAVAKGWIKTDLIDVDTLTAIAVAGFMVWSVWQQNHSAKKADLVTAVAVKSAVMSQTPASTPLSIAEQKAIVIGAKAAVKTLPEKQITDSLNASQLNPQEKP